jgi:hypothetical protein
MRERECVFCACVYEQGEIKRKEIEKTKGVMAVREE